MQPAKWTAPCREFHHEEQIESDQATRCPDFDRGEVDAGQHIPVRLDECSPGGLSLAIRRGLNAVTLENIADRLIGDLVPQIGQGTLDTVVAPRGVFPSKAKNQIDDLMPHARPTHRGSTIGVVPFLCHQCSVPT